MQWFRKPKYTTLKPATMKDRVPDNLLYKCENCLEVIFMKDFEKNFKVCPKCNYHFKLSSMERVKLLADEGTFKEFDSNIAPQDPLNFVDSKKYTDRLKMFQQKTGLKDGVISGKAKINGIGVILVCQDFEFIGGSMGSVVGEKVTRAIEKGIEERIPVIIVCASGGARMQEGILSLMQMAKTSLALAKLSEAKVPFITVLTDPTTAGVMASFASLGDVIVAEPDALIGFAGPRVIQQTINQILPKGFQKSEFVLEHGFIDLISHRKDLKEKLTKILKVLKPVDSSLINKNVSLLKNNTTDKEKNEFNEINNITTQNNKIKIESKR